MTRVYTYGSQEVTVPAGESIAVYTTGDGKARVFQKIGFTNQPEAFDELGTVEDQETVFGPFTVATDVRIDTGVDQVLYEVGSSPSVPLIEKSLNGSGLLSYTATRNTIADAGTVTVEQHRQLSLYQDASGGNVTMTSATGAQLDAAFPNLKTGEAIPQYHSSNDGTNTSTIAGGTGVTLVGSGAVINTGGQYLLIKTGTATYDLVRAG